MAENEEYQPIGRGRSRRSALSSPTKLDDDKQGMEPLGRSRGRAKRSLFLSKVSAHYPGEPADAPLSSIAVMTKPKNIQAGGDLVGTGLEPSSAAKSIGVSQSDADTRIRSSSNLLTSSQDVLNIGKRMSSLDIDARKVSPPGVQTSGRSTRGGTSAELGNVEKGGPRQKQAIRSTVWTKPKDMNSKKGTAGQVVQLNANYFRLPTVTNWQLYQYRVDFDPEEDRNAMKSRLVREHKAKLGGYLFDGTVLFSPRKYNPDPMIVFSSRPSDNVAMRITIRTVGVLAFGDYHYLHFFNLLMRRCLDNLQLQLVGRYYFDSSAQITVDKHQLELWPGYVTSIRQHENELLLCAEITHKVMRQDTVYTLLKECYSSDSRNFQRLFKQMIMGSIVLTDYNNKTYRIDDVEFSVTPASTFDWNGDETSYVKYYAQKYEMKIQDKSQPMLVSMPKQRDRRRGQNSPILLVPELCRMTGLSDQMRTNFTLMRDLADCTRLGPSQRMERLQHFNRRLRTNSLVSEELKSWNMEMSESLLALSGRIMPREKIILGSQVKCEAGSMNDWTKELRMHPMLITQEMDSWVVIVPSKLKRDVIQFVTSLRKAAYSMELRLPDPSYQDLPDDRMASYVEGIGNAMLSCNPRLILLVLPNNRLDRYSAIKKKCCVERPVPTQLILHKNLNKSVMSIATKVAIQINCKIGGAPWTVEIPLNGLMVVGFDVYHDTAQRGMSIGALVASLDRPMSRYFSAVSYHQTGEELSNELSANICKALQKYTEYNHGCLPQRIVIYRDGVGEGQIPYVFEHEVAILKAKLAQIYGENECKMAFIIVTKRIHTRIFCDGNNPPPGTVVDDVITLPERYDFFLVSQSVRQGTVSPTSYNVISDNVGLDPDKLQRLTYKLTHLYFNWSGTVRVPAPCQYAHKLAYLVGQALHKTPSSRLEDVLYFL